jgi:3-oxoadipate enol-lactonase
MSDFIGMLDALKIERVHYVGESLGSILGIALAATHPERVKSLTLVSPIIRARPEKTGAVNAVGYPSWADALQALGMKEWWLRSRPATDELRAMLPRITGSPRSAAALRCRGTGAVRFAPDGLRGADGPCPGPNPVLSPGISRYRSQRTASHPDAIQLPPDPVSDAKHIDCYLRPDRHARTP